MRKTKVRSFLVAAGVSLALAFTLSCSGEEASVIEGIDGNHGKDGVDGADGNHGIDGKDGADGVDGNHGIDGKDGADGADGNHGNHGVNGTDGKDGEKGDTGAKGDKGDTGAKGDTGEKGETGANGADGTNCNVEDKGTHFVMICGESKVELAKAMCGIKAYDPKEYVCKRGELKPLCGEEIYNPAERECENGTLKDLPLCGTEFYNPKKEQTCDDGVVKSLCGAKAYVPDEYYTCDNGVLKLPCGTELTYDPDLEICYSDGTLVTMSWCGETGYDKDQKICEADGVLKPIIATFTDDRDGQEYKSVVIGKQIWMAENLNYAASGSKCGSSSAANSPLTDSNTEYCDTYGRLYDWTTAVNYAYSSISVPSGVQGVCPAGWHIPSDDEWTILTDFVGGLKAAETKLKVTSGWFNSNGQPQNNGTDDFGFSALGSGYGLSNNYNNKIQGFGFMSDWWSATEFSNDKAYYRQIDIFNSMQRMNIDKKINLFSVRCVKNPE